MRRLLFIVIAAMGMFKGYSQALVQTYTDRCTGEVKVFSVPMNGATTIAFYNKSRTFTAAQFQNGELQAWLEETYNWWRALSPCSTNNATSQTTQQTTSQATTNATNAATNATSGATQNTGTTNTNTNGTSGTTGSTSTGGGTTSGGGTSGSSSNSGSSGSSTGGDSSSGSSGSSSSDNQSGSNNDSSSTDNSSGNGDSGNDNSSGGSESSEGSNSEENSSGESTEESSSEESSSEKEEVKEEKKEEKKKEEKEEEKKEEESSEDSQEEEEEEEKEQQLAPPVVTANLVTMQMIDGVLTNAASFGYSQSSLTGEDTYTANAMIWSNLKQYSINVSKSSVLFNWDRKEDIMVLDPFTREYYKFGEVAARGSIMKVQTISLGYMKMFTTHIATFGVSDVFLGQKDNFWKGFAGGYAITGMAVFLADNQYLGTAALTLFGTKPFVLKRLTISPMIAYSATPLTVDNISKKVNFNKYGNYVLGSNFDFNLTQRFKANIGGTVIGSTMPGMPLSWALTIGSRFQF